MKPHLKSLMLCLGAVLALGGTACGKEKARESAPAKEAPAAAPTAAAGGAASAEAVTLFKQRCEICHGASGKGDGPGSAALEPKPRDYTDVEWQKSVTDEDIIKTIVGGGLAVGKSGVMPAAPDLKDKQEILDGLVKHIRSFSAR